ncbi:MAG: insulinase family protein [Nitrospirae bacterium]|nr:insulinase family protein [Nitrospirota bacterium]MBI3352926.1 insulinase family protein [Nitrospirota bacterium]
MFKKMVLDNGIRLVTERIPSVKSVSIGIWVNVGSRDEEGKEHGLSHFLEHMFFKGTRKKSAKELAQDMDSLGGEMNAFTSRETTTFYTKVLDEHLPKAIQILSDVFHHSIFDPDEIKKEKKVILEEIKMVEDDPEELLNDFYLEQVWKKNPLGRTILGTLDTVSSLKREDILYFLEKYYHPSQIVISAAGNFNPTVLFRLLNKTFGKYKNQTPFVPRRIPPRMETGVFSKKKNLEQIHFCLGLPGVSHTDKTRHALYVLNTVLGGSVSSRLFQEVREERGLVYSIYSYLSFFQDTGLFTIYAGTSVKTVRQVVQIILKELRKLRNEGISSSELKKAKDHLKGSMMLGMESTSSRMAQLAKDEIYFGRFFTLEEVIQDIEAVSKTSVHQIARQVFDPAFYSLTSLGPLSKTDLGLDILSS